MTTLEIIKHMHDCGGFNIEHARRSAKLDGVTTHQYIKDWCLNMFPCSKYVAGKVADYYTQ